MPIFQAEDLKTKIIPIMRATGSSEAEALRVCTNLIQANLKGHDSHGAGMIPRYVESFMEGSLQPNQTIRVMSDLGSMLVLDGQQGFGQVVGEEAMAMGIARAKKLGSCIVSLSRAHHLGRIGHFAEMAAAEGLVSIHLVNVISAPVVAVWGGGIGRHGTNPFCIGVPLANRAPFILDFATSRSAQGKMRVAHNAGKEVSPGYLIDQQGKPTNDPGVVVKPDSAGNLGALMPFGEHKGSGLAIACELLGGALTGNGTWKPPKVKKRAIWNGMLSILINPISINSKEQFDLETNSFIDWVYQSPASEAGVPVMLAGEPEQKMLAQRLADGFEIDDKTWQDICAAGKKVGVNLN